MSLNSDLDWRNKSKSYFKSPEATPGQEPGPLLIPGFPWAALGFNSYWPRKEHGQDIQLPPATICVLVKHMVPIVKVYHTYALWACSLQHLPPSFYLSLAVQTNRKTWRNNRADGWASSNVVTCLQTLQFFKALSRSRGVSCHLPPFRRIPSVKVRVQGHYGSTWDFCKKSLVNSQMLYHFFFLIFSRKVQQTPEP